MQRQLNLLSIPEYTRGKLPKKTRNRKHATLSCQIFVSKMSKKNQTKIIKCFIEKSVERHQREKHGKLFHRTISVSNNQIRRKLVWQSPKTWESKKWVIGKKQRTRLFTKHGASRVRRSNWIRRGISCENYVKELFERHRIMQALFHAQDGAEEWL